MTPLMDRVKEFLGANPGESSFWDFYQLRDDDDGGNIEVHDKTDVFVNQVDSTNHTFYDMNSDKFIESVLEHDYGLDALENVEEQKNKIKDILKDKNYDESVDDTILGTSIHHVTVIGDDSSIVAITFANEENSRPLVQPILHISKLGCPCGRHTVIQGSTTSVLNVYADLMLSGPDTMTSVGMVALQLGYGIDLKDARIPPDVKVIEWNNDIISVK